MSHPSESRELVKASMEPISLQPELLASAAVTLCVPVWLCGTPTHRRFTHTFSLSYCYHSTTQPPPSPSPPHPPQWGWLIRQVVRVRAWAAAGRRRRRCRCRRSIVHSCCSFKLRYLWAVGSWFPYRQLCVVSTLTRALLWAAGCGLHTIWALSSTCCFEGLFFNQPNVAT